MREWKAGRTYGVSLDKFDLRLKHLHTPSRDAVEGMAASLKKRGQISPVIVSIESAELVLVDGFKRHAAASLIGLDPLSVMTVGTGSANTKALTYLLNHAKGFSMIEEALLTRELVEVDGLKQVEVASLLDHHKSWVHRRLELIRSLAPQTLEDLKLKLIPPGSASSLARLPKHNQADWSSAIQTHRLHSREVAELVDLWCKTPDPARKKYLMEFPRQALQILREPCAVSPDKSLRILKAFATQIHQDWGNGLDRLNTQTLWAVQEGLDQAEQACRTCFEAIRKHMEVPA